MADPAALEGRIAVIRDNGAEPHEVVNCIVAETVADVEALGPAHVPAGCYLVDVNALPVSPGWKYLPATEEFYREFEDDRGSGPVTIRETLKVDENDDYIPDERSGFTQTEQNVVTP